MSKVDFEASIVDWVIDHPASIRVFEELGIDYCCAGKSLACACRQAHANPAVVDVMLCGVMNLPFAEASCIPGWISHDWAETADPVALATEIHKLATAFYHWLELPPEDRWDNFLLQSLSAALFNRYATHHNGQGTSESSPTIGLLRLCWPPGSERIQICIAELQVLLIAPFSVFKAVRVPLASASYPSPADLAQAEQSIIASKDQLRHLTEQLGHSLAGFGTKRAG